MILMRSYCYLKTHTWSTKSGSICKGTLPKVLIGTMRLVSLLLCCLFLRIKQQERMLRKIFWTAVILLAHINWINASQWLSAPLSRFNGTITFDDLNLVPSVQFISEYYTATLAPSATFQNITLNGSWCGIHYYKDTPPYITNVHWLSEIAWTDVPAQKPGWYASTFFNTASRSCRFSFRDPIYSVSMRINSASTASFMIYDGNGKVINTTTIPQKTGVNTFSYFGYTSETKFSGFGVLSTGVEGQVTMDNVQWFQCPINQRLRGNICEDLCATVTCGAHASCYSSSGVAVCKCDIGYEGDGKTCTVYDPCKNATCSSNALCTSSGLTYTCTCKTGSEGDGVTCTDIDECSRSTSPCSEYASCNNTDGSFNCTCFNGFEGDGITCSDIDECSLPVPPCSSSASCENYRGGYNCSCLPGYEGDGFTCNEIDECQLPVYPCSADAACVNTEVSFYCVCNHGFEGDGITCTDIDECAGGTAQCGLNAHCNNTLGSFNCTCDQGYGGGGYNNSNCTDMDECALDESPCSSYASCSNTKGSYTCTCKEGYVGNGFGADGCRETDSGNTPRSNIISRGSSHYNYISGLVMLTIAISLAFVL